MKLQFYGYSDDSAYCTIIQADGQPSHQSIDCYERVATFRVEDPNGEGFTVSLFYSPDKSATWTVGMGQLDDGIPIPEWAERPFIQLYDPHAYTVCLEFENVPEGTKVTGGEL